MLKGRDAPMENDYLEPDEIARQLRVHPDTVRGWIRKKQLPAVRLGTVYRVKRSDLEKFLMERHTVGDDDQYSKEE